MEDPVVLNAIASGFPGMRRAAGRARRRFRRRTARGSLHQRSAWTQWTEWTWWTWWTWWTGKRQAN